MAYWLFSMRKITGRSWMPAKFIPSWKSPSAVAPSPPMTITTPPSPWRFSSYPMPAACGNWVAITDEWLNTLRSACAQWLGICRPPLDGSRSLENTPRKMSSTVKPRARAAPTSR